MYIMYLYFNSNDSLEWWIPGTLGKKEIWESHRIDHRSHQETKKTNNLDKLLSLLTLCIYDSASS